MDALLLGRRTYDIFAAYWPHADGDIARLFNRIPKYVASRQTPALEWADSTLLGPDTVAAHVHQAAQDSDYRAADVALRKAQAE